MSAPIWRSFMTEALRNATPVAFSTAATTRANVTPLNLPAARATNS
jgi:hypothetical protein